MTKNVLELPTLVLNRSWQPVHVTTVVRALVMLWNETAKVVEPDEYRLYDWVGWSELEPSDGRPCVRSAHRSFRSPFTNGWPFTGVVALCAVSSARTATAANEGRLLLRGRIPQLYPLRAA